MASEKLDPGSTRSGALLREQRRNVLETLGGSQYTALEALFDEEFFGPQSAVTFVGAAVQGDQQSAAVSSITISGVGSAAQDAQASSATSPVLMLFAAGAAAQDDQASAATGDSIGGTPPAPAVTPTPVSRPVGGGPSRVIRIPLLPWEVRPRQKVKKGLPKLPEEPQPAVMTSGVAVQKKATGGGMCRVAIGSQVRAVQNPGIGFAIAGISVATRGVSASEHAAFAASEAKRRKEDEILLSWFMAA